MNRIDELMNAVKTNEMLSELLHIKREEEKKQNIIMWILIGVGVALAVAGIAFALYRFFTPDYLEDFDDDFDDDDFLDEADDEEQEESEDFVDEDTTEK